MRWGLLFTDLGARIIGVFGLYCTALIITAWTHYIGPPLAVWGTIAGFGLFSFLMTCLYLLPNLHESILRSTVRKGRRVVFVAFNALWLLVSIGFFHAALRNDRAFVPSEWGFEAFAYVATAVAILFALMIFPFGLSYRPAEEEIAGARHLERFQRAQRRDEAAREDAAEATAPPRPRDIWDVVTALPLLILFIGSLIALRFGSTVQTASLDAWLDSVWFLSSVAFALIVTPYCLNHGLRPPVTRLATRVRKSRRRLMNILSIPMLGVTLHIFVGYDGVPELWNRVTTNPTATVQYKVTGIETYFKLRGCVRLAPTDALDQNMMLCRFGQEFDPGLRVGDVLEVTGELSRFGHTFEEVRRVN